MQRLRVRRSFLDNENEAYIYLEMEINGKSLLRLEKLEDSPTDSPWKFEVWGMGYVEGI